jgi:HSP20 family protein
MSIVRWNPAREFDEFFNRYGDVNRNVWGENIAASDWTPAVDVRETDHDFQIDIDLPAVAAEDVKVSIKDGVLAVTGERKYEKETEGKVHRVERRYGRFTRSFRLPENADENAVEARSKDGVLHVVVGKREEVKPRSIEIQVQ